MKNINIIATLKTLAPKKVAYLERGKPRFDRRPGEKGVITHPNKTEKSYWEWSPRVVFYGW